MISCVEDRLGASELVELLDVDFLERSIQMTPLGHATFQSISDEVAIHHAEESAQIIASFPVIKRTFGPMSALTRADLRILESRRKRVAMAAGSPPLLQSPPSSNSRDRTITDLVVPPPSTPIAALAYLLCTEQAMPGDAAGPHFAQQEKIEAKRADELTTLESSMEPTTASDIADFGDSEHPAEFIEEIQGFLPIPYQGDAQRLQEQIFARLEAWQRRNDDWAARMQKRIDALGICLRGTNDARYRYNDGHTL
ncbi:hypothetical protein B0H11DRAFT_2230113 [Mycena galericulata]|nr:hypothetical protein B0H11DRAFT_2230113 [Mycena galericulata]